MTSARMCAAVWAVIALTGMAGPAVAGTHTVGAGRSAPFHSLETAFEWCKDSGEPQTLELEDAYYTADGLPLELWSDVALVPAPDNTAPILIEKTTGFLPVFRALKGADLTVAGRAPDTPIRVRNTGGSSAFLSKGAGNVQPHQGRCVMTNVWFERPASGTGSSGNWFVLNQPNSAGNPDAFHDCRFIGGNPDEPGDLFQINLPTTSFLHLERCDATAFTAPGRLFAYVSMDLTAIDCDFRNAMPRTLFSNALAAESVHARIELVGCTFGMGTVSAAACGFDLHHGQSVITLERPEFASGCGDVLVEAREGAEDSLFRIHGEEGAPVDLTGVAGSHIVRAHAGAFRFRDVVATSPTAATPFAVQGALAGPVHFRFDRCVFRDGAGNVGGIGSVSGPHGVTVQGRNVLWEGRAGAASIISTVGDYTGPGEALFEHCTLTGPTDDVLLALRAGDALRADYTLFDAGGAQTGVAAAEAVIEGQGNAADAVGTFPAGVPADTLIGAPHLDGEGRPSQDSPLLGAATDSDATRDATGQARPQGDPEPDIGALESAFVAVDLTGNGVPDVVEAIDSDGDGISDYWERRYFGDLTTADATSDYTGDGFEDAWLIAHGRDPRVWLDPYGDEDGDGVPNRTERLIGTNPFDPGSRPLPAASVWALALASALILACAGGLPRMARARR